MRMRIAVPEEHVEPAIIDAALEAVTRLDESMIRQGTGPTSHELLARGAIWRPENMGDEHFDHVGTIAQRGWGDCDDWAPAHAATLRATGQDPGALARVVPSGPSTYHAVVQTSDGQILSGQSDISVMAGMGGGSRVSGDDSIEVWACDPHDRRMYQGSLAPTVGPLSIHCGPTFAVRGVNVVGFGPYFEARCDMPMAGSPLVGMRHKRRHRVHGRISVVGAVPYAIACIGHGASSVEALSNAMQGAVLCGDAAEMTTSLDRYKILAAQCLVTGMHPLECKERIAQELAKDIAQAAEHLGVHPLDHTHGMLAELASQGLTGSGTTGDFSVDVRHIAHGIVSASVPLARRVSGFDFGDIASAATSILAPVVHAAAPIIKPLEALYNKIPLPVKALLAPQTLVTEYAYAHPEQIPMFGSLATKAKAAFEAGMKSGAPVARAAQAAVAAIHPAAVPQTHAPAAHVLSLHLPQPPKPAPPAPAPKAPPIKLSLKPLGVPHAAMPVAIPAAAPPGSPRMAQPPGSPGAPPGATHWTCNPGPGGIWQCKWV